METFTVLERLKLLDILPVQGDITTIRIVRTLREELSFSEEEHKLLDFQTDGATVSWNPEVKAEKQVEVGDKARQIITESLKKASSEQRLSLDMIELYERFVKE